MKSAILVHLVIGAVSALSHLRKISPDRIVGGSQATKGEFPHIVQIMRNGDQYCSGSLINEEWIVTAAHCSVESVAGYTLVAGEHNLNLNEGTEQSRSVSRIVVHPDYSSSALSSDVALMKVSSPFELNKFVKAVTIPETSFTPASELTVAGWGTLSSGGSLPSILMKVTVPLVSRATCDSAYTNEFNDDMLCAGLAGKDSCQGDAGGPLMSGSSLAGIVSWRHGCAEAGYPGVYTNVAYFSTWIKNQAH